MCFHKTRLETDTCKHMSSPCVDGAEPTERGIHPHAHPPAPAVKYLKQALSMQNILAKDPLSMHGATVEGRQQKGRKHLACLQPHMGNR
jgi:hypothetical protein